MPDAQLAIVFDEHSAATPREICHGLAGIAHPIFVTTARVDEIGLRPLLAALGTVVPICGGPRETSRTLRQLFPDGITTFNEGLLDFTAALAAQLGLPFHSPDTVALATDKLRQRSRLRAAGVDTVAFAPVASAADLPGALERVGLPAIVKPARGGGSRHVYLVCSHNEGAELAARLFLADAPGTGRTAGEPFVAEEYLVGRDLAPFGDYVSVETVVSYGVASHLAITGKTPLMPPFREAGQFWPALLDPAEQRAVLQLTSQVIAALGVCTGMVHTEFKLTASGPRLIEFNGRMGGFMQDLSQATGGPDLIELAGRAALGERVSCGLLDTDRVAFQYWSPAPLVPCRLEESGGAAAVRDLPAVTAYHTYVPPGTDLEGGVMLRRLDFLSGISRDHAGVFAALDEVLDTLWFTFTLPTGRTTVTGRQLALMPENTRLDAAGSGVSSALSATPGGRP